MTLAYHTRETEAGQEMRRGGSPRACGEEGVGKADRASGGKNKQGEEAMGRVADGSWARETMASEGSSHSGRHKGDNGSLCS